MPDFRKLKHYLLLTIQTLIVILCLGSMFGGHHPPAHAQALKAEPSTIEDAMQDRSIAEINQHLESTDSAAQLTKTRQWDQINANTKSLDALAGKLDNLQNDFKGHIGEERDIAGLIGFLATSGIVIQIGNLRSKRKVVA